MGDRKASAIRGKISGGRAAILAAALFASGGVAAEPGEDGVIDRLMHMASMVEYDFDQKLQVRGWRILPRVYIGQATIAGEWGIGLLVERGHYAWGINNERLSFVMRW